MALIDVVSWDSSSTGNAGEGPVFAWKFDGTNLSTFTQLLVRESQEAILFTKGQLLGKFGPGKHTLNTENLPLLRNFFGLPFGGKNPFLAEVWFVNKVAPLNIDWDTIDWDARTANPGKPQSFGMMYQDPDYGAMVPLRAVGRYGLKVQDAERFLIKLVGTAREFNASELTEHFRGAMNAKTKTVLLSYMQSQRIGIKSISAYLEPLSQALKASMLAFWEDYGFSLEGFYITSVEIDGSTVEGRNILEAIAGQSAQLIAGYSWQQAQAFKVAEGAVDAAGKGGMLGALMMTNLIGSGAGGGMAGAMLQPSPGGVPATGASGQAGSGVAPVPREVFCSNCSKKYSSSSKFCPHCGDPYVPCPRCGADNDKAARRCVSCGTELESATSCPKCGMQLPLGAITCPRCIRGMSGSATCSQCGSLLAPDDVFCSECGKKAE